MKRPPPWWLRLPIYLDWIQLSFVILLLGTLMLAGGIGSNPVRNSVIILAALVLITLDLLGGLGHHWALLPRAALAFLALSWCWRTITWGRLEAEDWILISIGTQQLWVLVACIVEEVRLRLRGRPVRAT